MDMQAREALLLDSLRVAVPMWIGRHALGPPKPIRVKALTQNVAEHGDSAMFKTRLTATAFNAVAEGIALLARQPGGVDFCGQHWCTDHKVCEAAS